jgi:hypothetical protein
VGSRPRASALEDPRFLELLGQLSLASDRIWLGGLTIGLGFTLIAAFLVPFSVAGPFWAYAGLLLRAGLYLWSGDALRGRGGESLLGLFRMGIVAGFLEILVDWALVHGISSGRLVYLSGNDVVLLASPIWMPLAWACVIVEVGYPALRLFGGLRTRGSVRTAAVVSSVAAGVGAGLMVGCYEYFAYRAQWWKYERANAMVGDYCALYVPLGELLMFLVVLPIAARALSRTDRPLAAAIESGARFAAAIALGYAAAYLVLEAGRTP